MTLAQLIAFVSFQSRLIAGLRLLNDRPVATSDAPVAAGVWHTTATTATGKAAPVAFTQQELGWEPWIAAKPLADFRDDEVAIPRNLATPIPTISACWGATCRCLNSAR